jgi:hypothetical protein
LSNLPTDNPVAVAVVKPKHTLLPLLIVLFLISYGLMSMLVVEQGKTIDAQRYLIRELFGDSTQLTAMKGREQRQAQAQAKARAQAAAKDKVGSAGRASKLRRLPEKPPKAASDTADARRILMSI